MLVTIAPTTPGADLFEEGAELRRRYPSLGGTQGDEPSAGRVIQDPPVDRRTAQRNLTSGFLAAGLGLLFFGLTFFIAVIYIT